MDIVKNPNHTFMEKNISIAINRTLLECQLTLTKLTHTLTPNQEILYLNEIFQNVHLRFLDALDHLQNHPTSMDDTEMTTPRTQNSQDHSKRSILSGLGEIEMST